MGATAGPTDSPSALDQFAPDQLHQTLTRLAAYMRDSGDSVADLAYAIEKPWKYADLLDRLHALLTAGTPWEEAVVAINNWEQNGEILRSV